MPKHQIIYNDLFEQIQSGKLPPNSKLPTEKELCQHYSVSRITAMRAVNDLETAGIVKRTAGKGTFVKSKTETNTQLYQLILPFLSRRYYSEMANAFCQFLCDKNAIGSVIVAPDYDMEFTQTIINNINNSGINGLALVPSGNQAKASQLANMLNSNPTSTVIGSRELKNYSGTQLIVDEKKAGIRAVEHLVEQGHSRLAYIGPIKNYSSSQLRYEGFCEACHRNYLKSTVTVEHTDIIAFREIKDIFSDQENAPTAMIAADESKAMFLLEILNSLNLKCPKDIALLALDGGDLSPSLEVPLTAIEFPGKELGEEMAKTLWMQTNNIPGKPKAEIKKYSPQLVIRSSCGAQPARYRHEYLRNQLPLPD